MKNPLPIGFGARLKELIAEGLPPKEAMKEVWREVKKSRTKTGVHSGSREIFGRKRRKNPSSQTLSEWEEHWRLQAVRQKTGRTYIPGSYRLERRAEKELYNLSDFIVSSNVAGTIWLIPRKNPHQKKTRKNPLSFKEKWTPKKVMTQFGISPVVNVHTFPPGQHPKDSAIKKDLTLVQLTAANGQKRNYGFHNAKIDSYLKMRVSGYDSRFEEIVNWEDALKENPKGKKTRSQKKTRKNPIAIYNPPGKQKLLYGRAYIPVIRGVKTNGKYAGERYEHKFSKNEVSIYGNPDGSLIIKSNNDLRLWNYDKDI